MAPLASLDERIRIAIAEKRLLEFRYNRAARLGEPRDYGVIDGTARLLIQLHGPDSGKRAVGWRLLDVAKIESCVVTNRHFAGCRANRTGILPEPNRRFSSSRTTNAPARPPTGGKRTRRRNRHFSPP